MTNKAEDAKWVQEIPKSVVIVGSGVAGLACGAALSKYGVKPIIYEKQSTIGGRAQTWNINGFWIDHCPHMSFKLAPPMPPSEIKVAIHDAVGERHIEQRECRGTAPLGFYWKAKYYPLSKIFPVGSGYDRDFTKKLHPYLTDDDLTKVEKICNQAVAETEKAVTPDVMTTIGLANPRRCPPGRLNAWIRKLTDNERIYTYYSSNCKHYTQIEEGMDENMEQGIYGTTFTTIMLLAGIVKFCYTYNPGYGGDAGEIMNFANAINGRGGEIKTNMPVKRIVIEGGKVKGVVVGDNILGGEDFVKSDTVVVDYRPRLALRDGLITENDLKAYDPQTLESIRDIQKELRWEGASLMYNLGLRREFTQEEGNVGFADNEGHNMGCFMTKPTSAPPGMQEINFYVGFSSKKLYPNGKLDHKVAEERMAWLKERCVENWGKEFLESILLEEAHCFNESYQIYASFDPEAKLAPQKSGIEGLYWNGDEVEEIGGLLGNQPKGVEIAGKICKSEALLALVRG